VADNEDPIRHPVLLRPRRCAGNSSSSWIIGKVAGAS